MRWTILLGVMIFAGCKKAQAPAAPAAPLRTMQAGNGLPTIVVDPQHWIRNETTPSKPYFVPAGAGIDLQSGAFAFRDPNNLGREPNMIEVLYESSAYTSAWSDAVNQTFTLDSSTLKMIRGTSFSGFAVGKRAIVAIGFLPPGSKSPADDFVPFWIASVIFH